MIEREIYGLYIYSKANVYKFQTNWYIDNFFLYWFLSFLSMNISDLSDINDDFSCLSDSYLIVIYS